MARPTTRAVNRRTGDWKRSAALAGVAAAMLSPPASAELRTGSLDAPASDADYYQVTCSDDGAGAPASLSMQVRDLAPVAAPLVSLQIQKGNAATNGTDDADGDAGASPLVWINGGSGAYDAFVDKTAAGAESYELSFQCTTANDGGGAPTGTSIVPEPGPLALLASGVLLLACLAARRAAPRGGVCALAIGLWLAPTESHAHTQNGSLGAGASATDYYQVTCSDDGSGPPVSLALQILDAAPAAAPLVSVQTQRGTGLSNSTDAVDGDASASPLVWVNGGAGVYDVLIDKSGSGAETYTLTYHCFTGPDASGLHTGTSLATRQNQ